jgi:hypothetical protein
MLKRTKNDFFDYQFPGLEGKWSCSWISSFRFFAFLKKSFSFFSISPDFLIIFRGKIGNVVYYYNTVEFVVRQELNLCLSFLTTGKAQVMSLRDLCVGLTVNGQNILSIGSKILLLLIT